MSNLRQQIAALSPEKRALLLQRLKTTGHGSQTRIQPQNRQSPIPLSFAQERLWFLNQWEPESSAYNVPAAVHLQGSLNVAALEQSLNQVVRRHEVLRTTFSTAAGQPFQVILPHLSLPLPVVDLRAIPREQRQAEARRLATQEAHQPFDLTSGPLLRATLLQLDEREYVALLTMHHIVSDGWSRGILVRELAACYQACVADTGNDWEELSELPELPIQYADFAIWQRQWRHSDAWAVQRNYWKQQLGGTPTLLELPSDRLRPVVQSDRGATHPLRLCQPLTQALKALSQQEGATLFMTLLASFKVLLYRYTQQDDIWIGTPIANRNRSEIEGLIGFFVNTLVLRTRLSGNPSFRQFLQQVQQVALAAYAHQDFPFEQLVEELQVERDLSRHPLFQVMFILQNAPVAALKLPGLTLSPLKVESETATFDLTLSLTDTEEGLKGGWEYNSDLFDPSTIERLSGHFQLLLEGIVANPDQSLSDFPLLSAAEQQQLLVEWNPAPANTPDQGIHQRFEAQAKRTPDAIALCARSPNAGVFAQHLTYQALNQRANQLAHFLRQLGVGPEVRVGLCLERSLDLIVGLLGILKAGGAYVPLDPAYPPERLAFMLTDAQVSLLVTQEQLRAHLPVHGARVICTDGPEAAAIAQQDRENPTSTVTAQNLAYVIYTSGSTGQAKGVMVQHGSLINADLAWEQAYQLRTAARRHLQMASFSFDVFFGDLVRALGSGGTLVLCPRELLLDPQQLYTLIRQQQIDCAEFVPTVLRPLIQYLEQSQQRLDLMQLLICGSDSWSAAEYRTFQRFCGPQTRLINSFGVTEATIDSTYFQQAGGNLPMEQSVPIGRPFANTQLYILDAYLQPVPIGISGELYIGGAGLARGYLHRPALTAEKFIPHPFSDRPGARLYRTGDLARYQPDGNIQFLGRIDHQIKLRGYRIEPGEIEALLKQHPSVQEAVILVREDTPGNQRLVAYVQGQQQALRSSELSHFLQEQLPGYMVPTAYVCLEQLPLTPNGKLDRRALPAPDPGQSLAAGFVAPRSAVEKTLAELWAEILKVEPIGIHDSFFELGGHSLLTTQLLVRLRETFQVALSLQTLFESPTIAGLAESIERQPSSITDSMPHSLGAEVVLDPTIHPAATYVATAREPAHIFLTGATGFLGTFLLSELLQQTSATIYCLVRGSNAQAGKQKLQASLKSYFLWQECFDSRILPIMGDLSRPLLGLSEQQFQQMAGQLDTIYHNGAWVHHLYPYPVLKATNVLGTQEVLRLASRLKPKPVHFISTPSVFSRRQSDVELVYERDCLEDTQVPTNGYVQTKWVAEKLVFTAQERGLPVCIYRPGRISGHSQTGVFNPNDFLYRLIIGCLQLGSVPDKDIMEDIVPIDYVSKAIVHLSRQPKSLGKAFHLVHPQLLHSQMLINVIRAFGYSLRQVSYDEWRTELMKTVGRSPDHPLYPLIPFFTDPATAATRPTLQFDCQNTQEGLAGTAIACPPIDEQLLRTYCSYLIQNNFVNPLPSAR